MGIAAIQLAKSTGATVFGTARTLAKLEQVRELDLDVGFAPQRFAAEIVERTDRQGVQVVLDCVGAAYLEQNMQALSRWGRTVILTTMSGTFGKLNIEQLYGKCLSLKGVVLRTGTLEEKLVVTRAFAASVLPLLASGKVRPIIERTYSLTEISAAHTAMGNNQTFGKLILTSTDQLAPPLTERADSFTTLFLRVKQCMKRQSAGKRNACHCLEPTEAGH